MTDEALPVPVTTIDEPEPFDFTIVARNPAEMVEAQKTMIAWAESKIRSEVALADEAAAQFDLAKKHKWKISGWRKRLNLSQQRIVFYDKIKKALEAGYYIVPPFPIDLFAVRVNRRSPRWTTSDSKFIPAPAGMLPAGEGHYVGAYTDVGVNNIYERKPDGTADYNNIAQTWYQARDFQEVDFPFKLAKVEVLEETAKAFALKIFDQFGVLPKSPTPTVRVRKDPIVCGQILAPHKNREPITFFVAWWLDTKTL